MVHGDLPQSAFHAVVSLHGSGCLHPFTTPADTLVHTTSQLPTNVRTENSTCRPCILYCTKYGGGPGIAVQVPTAFLFSPPGAITDNEPQFPQGTASFCSRTVGLLKKQNQLARPLQSMIAEGASRLLSRIFLSAPFVKWMFMARRLFRDIELFRI